MALETIWVKSTNTFRSSFLRSIVFLVITMNYVIIRCHFKWFFECLLQCKLFVFRLVLFFYFLSNWWIIIVLLLLYYTIQITNKINVHDNRICCTTNHVWRAGFWGGVCSIVFLCLLDTISGNSVRRYRIMIWSLYKHKVLVSFSFSIGDLWD